MQCAEPVHVPHSKQPYKSLPLQLYVSTVDALYSDTKSLFAGTISSALAASLTYWKTGEWPLLACAIALVAIGFARGLDMRSYARHKTAEPTTELVRRWEVRYIIGSAAYVLLLGFWCFLTFSLTSDPVVHLISFSVMLAYLVGVTGRNFSSDQLVVTQTACAAPLMIAGLLAQADFYYAFLALLLVPFFLSIRFISARLRGILFNAVIASQDVKSIAVQFDTALNNMPHGLCMFDSEQRFVVANEGFLRMLGLDAHFDWRGVAVRDLLRECGRSGRILQQTQQRFMNRFIEMLTGSRRKSMSATTAAKQTLLISFQPMSNGGCVVIVEDITERRKVEARIEHMARFDALTGLPNRTTFVERFERILERAAETPRAVLFVDLDEFKQVNDTLGHPCGDALLCEVAARLRSSVRTTDIVARFGGDEFVVLQTHCENREDAAALAQRIVEDLSEAYEIEGHQIVIGASIGIAMTPQDGSNVDNLLKSADIALYRAKGDGRGVWRFFETEMDVMAQARRKLEMDLREALANNSFDVHYQPIVDVRTGKASFCEALVRWNHPQRGMISPAEFIPVSEEMGLIVEIGRFVLNRACQDCLSWPDDVGVSVNLSSVQFRRSNVVECVQEALSASGLAPERLELEITESILLQDTQATRKVLEDLRAMGVRIALDDFGTGYSSLSYLQAFPLNKIKIDRSFLMGIESDPKAMILLRGVARMSAELGMDVVMEGVETHQHVAALSVEKSVSHFQGYLFSAPLPQAKIHNLLRTERLMPKTHVA